MPKKNLLLVDADLKSSRMLEVSLRQAGFSVTTAGSGEDAATKINVSAPDLILTDTELPGDVSGLELTRRLKADENTEHIPIIFLSSEDNLEKKVRGLELGVEDYLTKPIYLREVLTRVKVLLEKIEKQSLAGRDPASNLQGRLGQMGLVDLIQTIEIGRKTGTIEIKTPTHEGRIYFRKGRVCQAETGELLGPRAFYRIMVWSTGTFSMRFGDHSAPNTIALSTQGLLMEGMRRVDEWGRLLEQLPPLDRVFEIDYGELVERLSEIPDEVNGILRLFDGQRPLLEIVNESTFGDLETLEVASKLYFEGLIFDVESRSSQESSPGKQAEDVAKIEKWLSNDSGDPFAAPLDFDAFLASPDTRANQKKSENKAATIDAAPRNPAPEGPKEKALADLNETQPETPAAKKGDDVIESPALESAVLLEEAGWEAVSAPENVARSKRSVPLEGTLLSTPLVEKSAAISSPLVSDLAEDLGLSDDEVRATLAGNNDTIVDDAEPAIDDDDAASFDTTAATSGEIEEVAGAFENEDSSVGTNEITSALNDTLIDTAPAGESPVHIEEDAIEYGAREFDDAPKVAAQPSVSFVDIDSRIEKAKQEEREVESLIVESEAITQTPTRSSTRAYILPAVIILIVGLLAGLALREFNKSRNKALVDTPSKDAFERPKSVDEVEPKVINNDAQNPTLSAEEVAAKKNELEKARLAKEAFDKQNALAAQKKIEEDARLAKEENDAERLAKEAELAAKKNELEKARLAKEAEEAEQERLAKEAAALKAEKERLAKEAAAKERALQERKNPKDPYLKAIKDATAQMRKGRFKSATAAYQKALSERPNSGVAHKGIGNAFFERDRIKDARKHLVRASQLLPRDPQVFLLLGAVYQSSGEKTKTINAYERYLELAPRGKHARDVRSILSRIKE